MADAAWFSTLTTLDELIKGRGPYRVADVLGAGGGLALGAVLEGFQLGAKREDGSGTGMPLMLANRTLLGASWNAQACPPEKWRGVTADVVVSAAQSEDAIGVVIAYAARLKPAVVLLDLVPDIFTGFAMAAELDRLTRLRYRATEITYNDMSLGGVLDRRRAFIVLSQVPFGVDRVAMDWLPVPDDAVMDLMELEPTWEAQRIYRAPTWYSRALRAPDHMVDGLMTATDYRSPTEWVWSRPAAMPSPSGLFHIKGRDGHRITHREIARLMGFPDTWRLGTAKRGLGGRFLGAHWEVTTSVHAARWVLRWIHASLDGHPGPLRGTVDISSDWKELGTWQWDRSAE